MREYRSSTPDLNKPLITRISSQVHKTVKTVVSPSSAQYQYIEQETDGHTTSSAELLEIPLRSIPKLENDGKHIKEDPPVPKPNVLPPKLTLQPPSTMDLSARHDTLMVPKHARPTWFQTQIKNINPGIFILVIHSLIVALNSLSVKTLASPPFIYDTTTIVFYRSVVVFTIGCVWVLIAPLFSGGQSSYSKINFSPASVSKFVADLYFGPYGVRKLIFIRSLAGFFSIYFSFFSLHGLSVGEATVISFIAPVFVGILAALILKERWEKIDACASFVCLFGVIIIVNPRIIGIEPPPRTADESSRIMYYGAGIMGAFSSALVYIFVRKLKNSATPMQVSTCFAAHSIYLSLIASWVISGSPWSATSKFPHSWIEVVLIVPCLAFTGLLNQVLLNMSLKLVTAAKASCLKFCQVPFSFLVDYIARGRVPTVPDVIGASTIISCVLAISLAKSQKQASAKPGTTNSHIHSILASDQCSAEVVGSVPLNGSWASRDGQSGGPHRTADVKDGFNRTMSEPVAQSEDTLADGLMVEKSGKAPVINRCVSSQ